MASDNRYIVGFKTEQDVRLTLAAMEKKGWKWLSGDLPTRWDGGKNSNGDYSNLSLGYHDNFGQGLFRTENANNINFKDAIRELTGEPVKSPVSTVTFDNIKDFIGRKFTALIGSIEIEGIIKQNLGDCHVTFYFNRKSEGNCIGWDTSKVPGYSKGWNVMDTYDFKEFNNFKLVNEGTVNPPHEPKSPVIIELPEYFTISSIHSTHPLWKKYISWLNKRVCSNSEGCGSGFYGVHKNGISFNFTHEMQGEKEVTLEEWDAIVNGTGTPEIPKYFYIVRDEKNPLWTEYFDWIQSKTEGSHWLCTDKNYVGYDGTAGKGGTVNSNNCGDFRDGTQEITLEFWDKYIRNPITTQYEKLVEAHKKVTTEDRFDPCSMIRYPIQMEPQLTPYIMSNPDLVAEVIDCMRGEAARGRTATGASTLIKPSHDGLIDELITVPMADSAFETAQKIQKAKGTIAPRMTVDVGNITTPTSHITPPVPAKKGSRYSDMLGNI